MTSITYKGITHNFPEGISQEEAMRIVRERSKVDTARGGASSSASSGAPRDNEQQKEDGDGSSWFSLGDTDPSSLQYDEDWLSASRVLWDRNNPSSKEFDLTDEELSDYGLDQLGWFNYNLPRMGLDAAMLRNADDEHKEAFLYMMDTYDDLELSWGGTWRFARGVAADPTTYAGAATFLPGLATRTATKVASKEAVRQALRTGVVTGIEGAAYGAADNAMRQSVRISAGAQDEVDRGEVGRAAVIGFGLGGVLGAGVDIAGTGLGRQVQQGENRGGVAGRETSSAPTPQRDVDSPSSTQQQPSQEVNTSIANDIGTDATPTPSRQAIPLDSNVRTDVEAPPVSRIANDDPNIDRTISDNPIIRAIQDNVPNTRLRNYPRGQDAIRVTRDAVSEFQTLPRQDVERVVEELRLADLPDEQMAMLERTVSEETERLHRELAEVSVQARTNEIDSDMYRERVDDLTKRLDSLKPIDNDMSSLTGSSLASRVGKINTGEFRDTDIDSILNNWGIPASTASPSQRARAMDEYAKRTVDKVEELDRISEMQQLSRDIDKAARQGDFSEATRLNNERAALREAHDLVRGNKDSMIKTGWKGINEWIIGNVFSTSTLMINIIPSGIKMAYRPFVDAIAKGMSPVAMREMAAQYAAFGTAQSTALRAAVLAFRYERGIINDNVNRFLEDGPLIKNKYGGGIVRFFPRAIGAIDEYFSQILYRGYTNSQAVSRSYEEGIQAGFRGKALDDYIDTRSKSIIERSFSNEPNYNDALIGLRQVGITRGYSGKKLDHFVKTELERNADMFRQAQSVTGLNYADDMLFKRRFTGEGSASRMAKGYENFVNNNPWMKLVGQLFFRTPVRVFEEGFRLTAGLNLVTPNFVRDLRGKGPGGPGGIAQIRAQGEAMLSYSIAVSAIYAYSEGMLVGGPIDGDWRNRRNESLDPDRSPYSIRWGDGEEFVFRNYDPFATPLKIVANAMDRFQMLRYREAQGEMIDQQEYQKITSIVSAGTLSVVQALRDANLLSGISEAMTAWEIGSDVEGNDAQLLKFLGSKAQLFLPNQWQKTMQVESNDMFDVATPDQAIRQRINPSDPLIPRRYDPTGFTEFIPNPVWSGFAGLHYSTREQRTEGMSDRQIAVREHLQDLSITTQSNFLAPYSGSQWPKPEGMNIGFEGRRVDLRRMTTSDGESTWYDRLQQYTYETGVVDRLYSFSVNSNLPKGTPTNKGPMVEVTQEILREARRQAFYRLAMEEQKIMQDINRAQQRMIGDVTGRNERPPFHPQLDINSD